MDYYRWMWIYVNWFGLIWINGFIYHQRWLYTGYNLAWLYWLVVSNPLKNISQLGWLFLIYGKIENVPNHQPDECLDLASKTCRCVDQVGDLTIMYWIYPFFQSTRIWIQPNCMIIKSLPTRIWIRLSGVGLKIDESQVPAAKIII